MTSELSARDEVRWQLVLARDRQQDGRFYFAVSTTGVYCRPSCPSRRPVRSNVKFYERAADAERSGYRACLRCRPNEVDAQTNAVRRACEILTARKDERITLQDLAEECGMSAFHLQRVFKRIVGVSPRAYQEAKRMGVFKEQLSDTKSVTDAVYAAGFGSSSRAYENVGEKMGMTPGQYRRAGSGQVITFGVFDSELGKLLVAATERGVCSLRLGDDEPELIQELQQEFRAARLVREEAKVEPLAAIVRDAVQQGGTPELPLDVQATAFQARVWQALRAIPAGETRTYAGLAAELGDPKAVRAVARACATNPVALAVPCHRVVRTGGALAGYRWGVERKRRLLEREAVAGNAALFKTSAGK